MKGIEPAKEKKIYFAGSESGVMKSANPFDIRDGPTRFGGFFAAFWSGFVHYVLRIPPFLLFGMIMCILYH